MLACSEHKAFVLGFRKVLCKTLCQIVLKAECRIVYKVIVQLDEHRQLVRVHGVAGEVIHTVLKWNAAALRHPCGDVGAVLGEDTACSVIGFHYRSHAAEQAFLLDCLLQLVIAAGGQCISAGDAVCPTVDLIVCVRGAAHGIPEVCAVFGSADEIFLFTV